MPGKKRVRVRVPRNAGLARFFMGRAGKAILVAGVLSATLGVFCFTYFYVKYSRLIDQKLRAGPFSNTSKIFFAPKTIAVGDKVSMSDIISDLRRSGYGQSRNVPVGWFNTRPDAIEIFPGPESGLYHEDGVVKFAGGKISQIISLQDNTSRNEYQLEPELMSNLYDDTREKRRVVRFDDIPEILKQAIISAEDKRFFQHAGFDPLGIVRAAYVDLKEGRKAQGASTLSQQTARSFWLHHDRSWGTKLAEFMITLELEQKLTKREIFELYCNQIDLGRRGTFNIRGFGEGAQAYFGKDIRSLTLPEAAMLAGLVKGPSLFNPFRHPERMRDRRNLVLSLMRQNGYITEREYAVAADSPIKLAASGGESAEAPWFVDMVNDELQNRFQDKDFQGGSYSIYTTLDQDLQRAATEAVRTGMQKVDELLRKQRRHRNVAFPDAQAALIALDPHTGEIKALVGGRNYGVSQLNHVVALRQPGSVFKSFVYAAALNSAIAGGQNIYTPASMVVDEPTTFWFDGKPYEPGNFKHEYHGEVTYRQAIAKSMNVATIKVAEMIGYDAVVRLAKKCGLNEDIQATPAVALGAYETTPIEIAGAYTVFGNEGVYVKPGFISRIHARNGNAIYTAKTEKREVLDPRVAYLMVSMLQEVMRSGTAAAVRARGFTVPAAGKTGTSHDGWFAGFTSELLCVVWVGFDDNRQLNLEGAHSAAPIWADFMKRALEYRPWRNTKPFAAPDGIVSLEIDPLSGMPATPFCPGSRTEVFIAGTEPVGNCPLHGGGNGLTNVAGWEVKPGPQPRAPETASVERAAPKATPAVNMPVLAANSPPPSQPQNPAIPPEQPKKKKRGFFGRMIDVFK